MDTTKPTLPRSYFSQENSHSESILGTTKRLSSALERTSLQELGRATRIICCGRLRDLVGLLGPGGEAGEDVLLQAIKDSY